MRINKMKIIAIPLSILISVPGFASQKKEVSGSPVISGAGVVTIIRGQSRMALT
jgi:hypothetical protein